MKVRYAAFVLGAVVALAAGAGSAGLVGPLAPAGAAGGCGPTGQPCTWNFSAPATGGANVYAAQAAGHEGAGVLVAVVDTWVDAGHPAFGGRVVDQANCVGSAGNPTSCRDHSFVADACVHGTHVAGTIASSNYGVAPRADILAVQVLTYDASNGDCSGNSADVAGGILFAVDHGARVINLSLGDLVPGFTQDQSITAAVQEAASKGAVVVFAAGNTSLPVTDNYGANAVLVAATGPSGGIAGYSQRGGSVNLAAPGGDDGAVVLDFGGCNPNGSDCILSTFPNDSYGLLEGTSMAAPHVSGAAALLFAENPSRTRADVIHVLEATAQPLSGAGSGRLNAGAALAAEAPAPPTSGSGAGASSSPTTGLRAAGAYGTAGRAAAGESPQQAASLAPTPATTVPATLPPVTVPQGVPANGVRPPRAESGGALHGAKASAGPVAPVGALAAFLLLLAAGGTGMTALRRRQPRTYAHG